MVRRRNRKRWRGIKKSPGMYRKEEKKCAIDGMRKQWNEEAMECGSNGMRKQWNEEAIECGR
jgi:hypothetical protein